MSKRAISTKNAPAPGGPYSQGVRDGRFVFVSGQLGFDPETGELVQGGIEPETRLTFKNVEAVLEAAGAKMSDVVKVQILLLDLADFAEMNRVYQEVVADRCLGGAKPTRTTFQAGAMPRGSRIEVDVIAIVHDRDEANV